MVYATVRISNEVKEKLDADKGEDENRNEQIERLLNGNTVPPHPESIEERLKAIESLLRDAQEDRSEGMVNRIDRLENVLEEVSKSIERIEQEV